MKPSNWILILILLLPASSWGEQAEVSDLYDLLRNGRAPVLSGDRLERSKNNLLEQIQDFQARWNQAAVDNRSNCKKFAQSVTEVLNALQVEILQLDAISAQPKARLHILTPTVLSLYDLFSERADGGYEALSGDGKVGCSYRTKTEVRKDFGDLVKSISRFHLESVGNPGLLGFDHMMDDLLEIAERDERSHTIKSTVFFGGSIVASLALWSFVPVTVVRLASLGGWAVGELGAWTSFGLRTAAIASENLLYDQVETNLNPTPFQRNLKRMGSWEERVGEAQDIAKNSGSAAATFAYINEIRSQMIVVFSPLFERIAESHMRLDDLGYIRALAKESLSTSNQSVSAMKTVLMSQIEENFGYHVTCANGWINSLNDFACLRGLRKISHLLSHFEDVRLPKEVAQVVHIELIKDESAKIRSRLEGDKFSVRLPQNIAPEKIKALLGELLSRSELPQAMMMRAKFEDYQEHVRLNLGVSRIDFDPEMDLTEKWRTLSQLDVLAQKKIDFLIEDIEVLHVGPQFRNISEQGLAITIGISSHADWATIGQFIDIQTERALKRGTFEKLKQSRVHVQSLKDSLQREVNISVECANWGRMTSFVCEKALERLTEFVGSTVVKEANWRKVLISPWEDLSRAWRYMPDGEILALRSDFQLSDLEKIGFGKGI